MFEFGLDFFFVLFVSFFSVLGVNWKQQVSGRDLAELIEGFSNRLDPQQIVLKWQEEVQGLPDFDYSAQIFTTGFLCFYFFIFVFFCACFSVKKIKLKKHKKIRQWY